MHFQHLAPAIPLALSFLLLVAGCGGPKLVPVSGTVTIDGKPLTHGYVFVMPKDNRAAGGSIDAQGRFRLTTINDGDGCYLGTHQVTVTSTRALSQTSVEHLIPKKYGQPGTSETTVAIDGPTDKLVIALTWAGGKPYIESFDGRGDYSGPATTDEPQQAMPKSPGP